MSCSIGTVSSHRSPRGELVLAEDHFDNVSLFAGVLQSELHAFAVRFDVAGCSAGAMLLGINQRRDRQRGCCFPTVFYAACSSAFRLVYTKLPGESGSGVDSWMTSALRSFMTRGLQTRHQARRRPVAGCSITRPQRHTSIRPV